MMKKLKNSILFCMFAMFMIFSVSASAKTGFYGSGNKITYYNSYGNQVKGTWFKVGNNFYYAKKDGYLATGLRKIRKKYYYFLPNGVNQTGWQTINGYKYYFMKSTRDAITGTVYTFANGKTYAFDEKGHMLKGWQKINDHYYYFKNFMRTGWLDIGTKRYYLIKAQNKKGQRATGLFSVQGKLYYFSPTTGVMAKNTTVKVKSVTYDVDSDGVCTAQSKKDPSAPSSKMLFFLTFESGSEAYNQTGGDNGNACGAYQFDNRYSLLPLVKYAYKKDPTLCAEFKKYASYTDGTKLKSNTKFYKAWHTIYNRNPKKFAAIQDTFAKENYYDPCETSLLSKGIDIRKRPDAVKGAVYSYSIQHGAYTAVLAVEAAKITNATSDKAFLKKLYNYRKKKYSAYATRYDAEYIKALENL